MHHEHIERAVAEKKTHSNVKTVMSAFPQEKLWIDKKKATQM